MLPRQALDNLLLTMLRSHRGVSDLFLTAGRPPQVESDGALVAVSTNPPLATLSPYQTEMMALALLDGDKRNLETLAKTGSCDCAYEIPGECRFRVNVFQQQRQYSVVMRKLESHIKSIEELGLPPILGEMAQQKNGLILVTGSTGSGKSTTLAALLNEMNETRPIHILTLEDPIEFVHPKRKATFNQRELGTDFESFAGGLRAALRQAPKVILVGEMRDRVTVDIGLAAASTGHLVVSTLHSIDCGQTINRIVRMFDNDEELQVRSRLADCLRYVVNQRLLQREGGGRVAAQEIMGMNLRIKELILKGESQDKSFYDVIGLNRNLGWQNHDQCIVEHYREGRVSEATALANASRRSNVARAIDRIKQEGGHVGTSVTLSLDSSSEEAQRLMDATWPMIRTSFPIHVDVRNEGKVEVLAIENGVPSGGLTSMGDLRAAETRELTFPAVFFDKKRLRRADGTEGTNAELTLRGEVSCPNVSIMVMKDFRVVRFSVNGVDRTEQHKTMLEVGLPLDIDTYTTEGVAFTGEKASMLKRIGEIGTHIDKPKLRLILKRSVVEDEKTAIEKTIHTIEEG